MAVIDNLRKSRNFTLFILYLRYLLGGAFVYSGIGKAMGARFIQAGSMQIPQTGMTIDVFFETLYRTGTWWQFLGWGQVVAGFFLLTQRWSTLGAILFLPVILNIFVITLSMDFHGTPFITGLMLLGNLLLLTWDHQKLRILILPNRDINQIVNAPSDQLDTPYYWELLGIFLLITSLSFGNRTDPITWSGLCFLEGLLGLLLWRFYKKYRLGKGTLKL